MWLKTFKCKNTYYIMSNVVLKNRISYLGDGEKSDPSQDDQCHEVHPTSDVGQEPKSQSELDRLDHVVDEEESAKIQYRSVQLVAKAGGHFGNAVFRDCRVNS